MKIPEVAALAAERERMYGPPPINQEIKSKAKSFADHMQEQQKEKLYLCAGCKRWYPVVHQYDLCKSCLRPHLRVMTEVIDRWR